MTLAATTIIVLVISATVNPTAVVRTTRSTLFCYKCVGYKQEKGCYVPDATNEFLVACPMRYKYCYKKYERKGGYVKIIRGCSEFPTIKYIKFGCTYFKLSEFDEVVYCFCESNKCNMGTTHHEISKYKVLVIVMAALLHLF